MTKSSLKGAHCLPRMRTIYQWQDLQFACTLCFLCRGLLPLWCQQPLRDEVRSLQVGEWARAEGLGDMCLHSALFAVPAALHVNVRQPCVICRPRQHRLRDTLRHTTNPNEPRTNERAEASLPNNTSTHGAYCLYRSESR